LQRERDQERDKERDREGACETNGYQRETRRGRTYIERERERRRAKVQEKKRKAANATGHDPRDSSPEKKELTFRGGPMLPLEV
jgi:hypothetical protein